MTAAPSPRYLTIPRWNQLTFLTHGFGLSGFGERDLVARFPGFVVVTGRQVHSDAIVFVTRRPARTPRADALATDKPGIFLVVKTADCLPILLADEERRVVAVLHCGWRGTARGLAEKAVRALAERYGSRPAGLLAAFGPCIQKYCYEVGEDVRRAFTAAGLPLDFFEPHPSRRDKFHLDLQAANRYQLLQAGLDPGQMNFIGDCTHCQPRFESYRRDGDRAGRMLAFLGLNPGRAEKRR